MVLVATQVKRRRGTTAENDAFTGAEGEITVDLGNKELRVHAGDNKAGGYGVARKDFKNLTDEAKNIGNWSSNVSNCITEIPQDISATITNGHLIVNAGSKVYFPNGSGTFDVFTLPSNLDSGDVSSITDDYMFCINNSKTGISGTQVTNAFSGPTAPAGPGIGTIWYDTTNNSVKRWNGSAWVGGFSFPVVILSAGAVLNQVFNGFGYIGSTVFVLPNVKGLIPNGRNADGTLNNKTSYNSTTVKTITPTNGARYICLSPYSAYADTPFTTDFYYDETKNMNFRTSDGVQREYAVCGTFTQTNSGITNFSVKTPFHALNYNDSEYIAHNAMPSTRYVDLTLGASGASYTAPADGYFHCSSDGVVNIRLINQEFALTITGATGFAPNGFLPVKKGEIFIFSYSSNQNNRIRFYYAQGAQ